MSKKEQKNYLLFNALFRHQVYLEGVKASFVLSYSKLLKRVARITAANVGLIQYSSLDQLSRRELAQLISRISKEQKLAYTDYSDNLLADLRDFVDADSHVTQEIYSNIVGELPQAVDEDHIWNDAINEPIPANGIYLEDALNAFANAAMANVLASVQQSYANSLSPAEAIKAIVGDAENRYKDGVLAKLLGQNQSLLNTSLQHISAITQATVATQFYDEYMWVSILDNKTTEICWSRNGVIYRYGEGPLPPAHYNCRSKAVPNTGEPAFPIPKTYFDWFSSQDSDFQNDVLGESTAAQLRNGELTASSFASISTINPLSLQQFTEKIKFIIGG